MQLLLCQRNATEGMGGSLAISILKSMMFRSKGLVSKQQFLHLILGARAELFCVSAVPDDQCFDGAVLTASVMIHAGQWRQGLSSMTLPRWPTVTGVLGASKKVKSVPAVDPADSNIELADFQGMPRCYESGPCSHPLATPSAVVSRACYSTTMCFTRRTPL